MVDSNSVIESITERLGFVEKESGSFYRYFDESNGCTPAVRISNHRTHVSTWLIERNKGISNLYISIVFENSKTTGGNEIDKPLHKPIIVHEYVYNCDKLNYNNKDLDIIFNAIKDIKYTNNVKTTFQNPKKMAAYNEVVSVYNGNQTNPTKQPVQSKQISVNTQSTNNPQQPQQTTPPLNSGAERSSELESLFDSINRLVTPQRKFVVENSKKTSKKILIEQIQRKVGLIERKIDECMRKKWLKTENAVRRNYHLLNEMTATDINQTYYPNIPEDVFRQITSTDEVTTNLANNKLGKYAKWLLWLYTDKKRVKNPLKLEDLYKAKEYIPVFDKLSKSNKLKDKNLNSYLSLSDMYVAIRPFLDGEQSVSKGEEIRQIKHEGADKLYEDERFIVIHPKTKEAAIYYGKNTQWCTAATENNMFDYYNKEGPLYIIIDKSKNRKYQFSIEGDQFMDENDTSIRKPVLDTIGATNGFRNFIRKRFGFDKEMLLKYQKFIKCQDNTYYVIHDNDGKYKIIDSQENVIKTMDFNKYKVLNIISAGGNIIFTAKKEEKNGIIDIHNNVILPFEYDDFFPLNSDADPDENFDKILVYQEQEEKFGVFDIYTKTIILPVVYDNVRRVEKNKYIVGINSKIGVINDQNKTIIPFEDENTFWNNKLLDKDWKDNYYSYTI